MFLGKGVLIICSKFTGEHPCQSVISVKLQSNFIEIAPRHGCSPVNLLHIFRTPFFKNTSGCLLLFIYKGLLVQDANLMLFIKIKKVKKNLEWKTFFNTRPWWAAFNISFAVTVVKKFANLFLKVKSNPCLSLLSVNEIYDFFDLFFRTWFNLLSENFFTTLTYMGGAFAQKPTRKLVLLKEFHF